MKGKTIGFYGIDDEGEVTKTKKSNSYIERKIFKMRNKYVVADYYISNKQPALIFETKENLGKYSELKISRDKVSYYGNGKLESVGKYENEKEIGESIYFKEYGEKVITITEPN